jgi:hypothetical protein
MTTPFSMHTNRQGDQIMISMMEDSHLKNTIHMLMRQLTQSANILTASVTLDPMTSAFTDNVKQEMKGTAKLKIEKILTTLNGYLVEYLLVRGNAQTVEGLAIVQTFQDIFKRSAPVPQFKNLLQSVEPYDEDDELETQEFLKSYPPAKVDYRSGTTYEDYRG